MKAKDLANGMQAVLIGPFIDRDGLKGGDVVTVMLPAGISKEKLLEWEERNREILVRVYNKAGLSVLCFSHMLGPLPNHQLELF